MLVSLGAVIAAPLALLVLFGGKVGSKIFGLYPIIGRFRKERSERWYYTLMMSTGLTFGTISALYGFSHGIVSEGQYSLLVTVVIGTAVIPTLIAGIAFVPRHLLPTEGQVGVPAGALVAEAASTQPAADHGSEADAAGMRISRGAPNNRGPVPKHESPGGGGGR